MGIIHKEISEEVLERLAKQLKKGSPKPYLWASIRSEISRICPHDYLTDSEVRYVLKLVRAYQKFQNLGKKKQKKVSDSEIMITPEMRREAEMFDRRYRAMLPDY
jgi:hypothetical protein